LTCRNEAVIAKTTSAALPKNEHSGNNLAGGRMQTERISGPLQGLHVATYACPVGEYGERFIGYARLCRSRPRSFWDAVPIVDVIDDQSHSTPQRAHRAAYVQAVRKLLALGAKTAPLPLS
jgi:hypothetical protein